MSLRAGVAQRRHHAAARAAGRVLGGAQARSRRGAKEPLVAQALVLSDGERTAAIVATDLVFAGVELTHAVREHVTRLTGIPASAVSVHASHNHSAPSLVARLDDRRPPRHPRLRALRRAPRRPARRRGVRGHPAARARAHRLGRRQRARASRATASSASGRSTTRSRSSASTDANGDPLAAVVSFAVHPITVGGSSLLWDTDYIGPLRETVEAAIQASRRSSCRAARATSRRSTTGGSATRARAAHGYERARPARPGHRRGRARALSRHRDDATTCASPPTRSCSSCGAAATPYDADEIRARIAELEAQPEVRTGRRSGGRRCTR